MATNTSNLNIKLIQPTDRFSDDTFNSVIEDIDNKVVGVSHLTSGAHFEVWTKSTSYQKGDVVRTPFLKSNQYLECLVSGTSGSSCPTDSIQGTRITDNDVTWVIKALGVVDTSTVSLWASNWDYVRGHIVMYNNCLYRCKTPHTSSNSFDLDASLWQEVKASVGLWKPLVYYYVDDIVVNDGLIYKNNVAHVSDSTFSSTEEANWEYILGGGNNGISQWKTATKYKEGNVVLKNNTPYISNTNHTSNTFADDFQKWDLTYSNIRDWEPDVFYHKGSLVVHNDAIFQANTPHLSVDFDTDIGAVFQTTEPYGYDYIAISPNLVVVFKEETDLTGFLILQSEKTRTNGASLTTVDVDITDSNNVTKTVKVTVGTKLEVTEKATSIKFKNPVGVNGSVTEYVNQTSLILVYGKDVSCWTSLINPNKITKKQIDALF